MNQSTIDARTIDSAGFPGLGLMSGRTRDAKWARTLDATASGGAFLQSALTLLDPIVGQPLQSSTYPRDIPMQTGGGWNEFEAKDFVDYAVAGGTPGAIFAGGATNQVVLQYNLSRDNYPTHIFDAMLRIKQIDLMRMQNVGQSLEKMLNDGMKRLYTSHMNINCYLGYPAYGSVGICNNPNITIYSLANAGTWASKISASNGNQILQDINRLLQNIHSASGYDENAVPNHVLLPYAQWMALTAPLSIVSNSTTIGGATSLLDYILKNNYSTQRGTPLSINPVTFCSGAGAGSTTQSPIDRMVAYCMKEEYLAMRELMPLTRQMTQPNAEKRSYDTVFASNVGQAKFTAWVTMGYMDGV